MKEGISTVFLIVPALLAIAVGWLLLTTARHRADNLESDGSNGVRDYDHYVPIAEVPQTHASGLIVLLSLQFIDSTGIGGLGVMSIDVPPEQRAEAEATLRAYAAKMKFTYINSRLQRVRAYEVSPGQFVERPDQ